VLDDEKISCPSDLDTTRKITEEINWEKDFLA
jgi:hypothetical protein